MATPSLRRCGALLRAVLLVAPLALAGCDTSPSASAPFDPNPGNGFDPTFGPDVDAATFIADVTNPFFPLTPGTTYRYETATGEGAEVDVVEVTDQTVVVAGVTARVVHDQAFLDGALAEDTFDWYAQDEDGNVWYLGEQTCEYEDGACADTAGSWEAGVDGARAGIVMPAEPAVGQRYYQEYLRGEAEDRAAVVSTEASVTVPYGTFSSCVETLDETPLDPGVQEHKVYCAGVGTVLEVDLATGDRTELVGVAAP